jgi:hypothetical protein
MNVANDSAVVRATFLRPAVIALNAATTCKSATVAATVERGTANQGNTTVRTTRTGKTDPIATTAAFASVTNVMPLHPYQATLSDALRLVAKPEYIELLKEICQRAVDRIADDAEVASTLRAVSPGGAHPRRQIDIRPHGSERVVLKLFVAWAPTLGCWHVFVEGGEEMVLESLVLTPESN